MNSGDSSDQRPDPTPTTAIEQDSSRENLSQHSLSSKTEYIKTSQIPHQLTKKHAKNLTKLDFILERIRYYKFPRRAGPPEITDIQIRKKTPRLLQGNKKLVYISVGLDAETSFDLIHDFTRLKYLQNIKTLDLNIADGKYFTLPNIKLLSSILPNLKNLTTLSLQFPKNLQIPLKLIDRVFLALKRLGSLSRLTVKFNSRQGFGDAHMQKLALHLSRLSKLQGIVINIKNSIEITKTGIQPLSYALKKLLFLSKVSIKLPSSSGSSVKTIHGLFSALATLNLLKELELSLRPDSDYDCNQLEPISLGLHLLNAPSLREISLELYPTLNDFGITELSKILTRFSSLKALSLDFSRNCIFSDIGIFRLRSALRTMTSLSSLSLSRFGHSKLLQGIELVSEGIVFFTQLKSLSLDFTCCPGKKYTTIETFSYNLQKLKGLKELNLNFAIYRFLKDEDFPLLAQGLETLKDLISLTINLNQVQLTNEGLKSLVSSFPGLLQLAHLTLKLHCNKTDGDALKIIARGLQSLSSLYSFNLLFFPLSSSNYNEGFEVLCETLQHLPSLKEIHFEANTTEFAGEKIRSLERVKCLTAKWYPF